MKRQTWRLTVIIEVMVHDVMYDLILESFRELDVFDLLHALR